MTQSNERPSWYKIGNRLFSESGNPIFMQVENLAAIQDFAVTDTPNFYAIAQTAKDFKMLPSPDGISFSQLTYKIPGKVSDTETYCRTVKVPQSAIEKYNVLRGLAESPTRVDMTAVYQEVAKFTLAIPDYSKAPRRACDIHSGFSFVGTRNYVEYNPCTVTKPQGEDIFLKELYTELGSKYIDDPATRFYHIMYLKKKFLIVENGGATIFLEQKPSILIPSEAITGYITKLASAPKKLVWSLGHNTHKDIKACISGMHRLLNKSPKFETLILISLESKPQIKLKLREDLPTGNLSFSVLTPFEWSMKQDQKMEIYEVPNMLEGTRSIYQIQYFIDIAPKTKKKDETHIPQWILEKSAILTP